MAASAAALAPPSPLAVPIPISALPALDIIVFTSAKSALIKPGTPIKSEIPCTPWRRTSSAMRKASSIEVRRSITCSKRSLGMVIRVSTFSLSFTIPFSAWFMRRRPSNIKGLVTTPTVRAPTSLAHSATTWAAPVPVPPPIPAVTKTMSAPFNASTIWSRDSSQAFSPISGLAPAPKPLVSFSPIWILFSALDKSKAWASQFTAINSTPRTPAVIILLTALLPPPPTPITLILARFSKVVSTSSNIFYVPLKYWVSLLINI